MPPLFGCLLLFSFTLVLAKVLFHILCQIVVKGDGKYLSIAAASVLAKTYRDDYMEHLHESFPMYGWKSNKGYPTSQHRQAIRDYGSTEHHRQSFQLLPAQLKLDLPG